MDIRASGSPSKGIVEVVGFIDLESATESSLQKVDVEKDRLQDKWGDRTQPDTTIKRTITNLMTPNRF